MSILVGSNQAKKMFLGTTEIKSIHLGTDKVWPGTQPTYVAVGTATGSATSIWKSADFSGTWTACSNITGNIYTIAYGNGVFVCGGAVAGTAKIYWSTDLITWTECTGDVYTPNKIVFGNGIFVASANVMRSCLYSTDGKVWHRTSTPTGYDYPYLAFGNSIFVMANNREEQGYTIWSTDGITWTIGMEYKTTWTLGLCYGHNGFVTVSYSGYNPFKSTNGKSWSTYSPTSGVRGKIGYDDVSNCYITTATTGTSSQYTNTIGSAWTASSLPSSQPINSIAEAGGNAFVMCNNGYVRKFTNGSWSEKRITDVGVNFYDMAYGEAPA